MIVESLIKKLKVLKSVLKKLYFKNEIRKVQHNQKKALAKIKNKPKIKVAFFLIHHADWKYEGVYRLMENDNCFEPIVFVCPYITLGQESMLKVMSKAFETFKNEGYNVIKTLDDLAGTWLDIKREINPDIVCFTSPWDLTRPEYLINNYLDVLTCYVPYGYKISFLYEAHFNLPMQNLVWKFFVETEIHKKLSLQYSRNESANTVVTGYPGMDKFLQNGKQYKEVWKVKSEKLKRIIWAPHHTIPDMGAKLDYSTFLKFADFMLLLADERRNDIQIAFKPHPILRVNLSKPEVWGKEKTDAYYQKWKDLPNGQLNEGEYIDLFFTSDGIIHDSGSFVIEYLYTYKPVMFLFNDESVPDRFNEIGKMALSKFYPGKSEMDIKQYVQDIIIEGNDTLQAERVDFFRTVITSPNNITASENIYNHIKFSIFSN
ncbi:CDP-glycerol glycerophosphotransferase family protein [Draconibacterium sp.]|jgi:hypothetical protein